jgi:hypothetical protein
MKKIILMNIIQLIICNLISLIAFSIPIIIGVKFQVPLVANYYGIPLIITLLYLVLQNVKEIQSGIKFVKWDMFERKGFP